MTFIQMMDYTTSKPDEMEQVAEEWERATEGKRTANRIVRTRYHDDPNRCCDLVFFDSHEAAMENSELPETQEYATKEQDLVDGEITYVNLDVVEDRQL